MAHIPQSVLEQQTLIPGLKARPRGKVGDSYELDSMYMLQLRSDRCSIFDFVLNLKNGIPKKGEVLNALTCFWETEVINGLCENDLVTFGSMIDPYLPEELRGDPDTQKRGRVVRILPETDIEDIVRIGITGTGFKSYLATGAVCGHSLPPGLMDGNLLPKPIYTPSTKAKEGHDEHVTAQSVADRYGTGREELALKIATVGSEYASQRGIILVDTKFEFSRLPDGRFALMDEVLTPDSSRFLDKKAYIEAQKKGKLPPSLDKQYVRKKGIELGIDKLDPRNPDHLALVDSMEIPEDVVRMTTLLYRYIFWRLTDMKLETYQRERMGIGVSDPHLHIEVIIGSKNDLPQLDKGLKALESQGIEYHVHVMSCHRNPKELRGYLAVPNPMTTAYIAAAGKLAALAGDIKSILCAYGHSDKTVIGVGLEGETGSANQAARLSMEELPGQPVELDPNGKAYFGEKGFLEACQSAMTDEFLPRTFEPRLPQMDIRQFVPAILMGH